MADKCYLDNIVPHPLLDPFSRSFAHVLSSSDLDCGIYCRALRFTRLRFDFTERELLGVLDVDSKHHINDVNNVILPVCRFFFHPTVKAPEDSGRGWLSRVPRRMRPRRSRDRCSPEAGRSRVRTLVLPGDMPNIL